MNEPEHLRRLGDGLEVSTFSNVPAELAERMSKLHRDVFKTTGQRGWSADEVRSLLESDSCFAVAATKGRALIGMAIVRKVLDEAELLTLAVATQTQRAGIGAQLLKAAAEELMRTDAAKFFLEVRADNAAAIALYHKAGFHQSALRRQYYKTLAGDRIDALIFELQLAGSGA